MKSFNELTLAPQLQKALVAMNFNIPTPIQSQAIPVALSGKDLIGVAQTGTGKTAAFAIPILQTLNEKRGRTALVLVPTRELAAQVTEVFRQLTLHSPMLRTVTLIGGVSMQPQLRALSRGFSVIVATPGRLVDHLQRNSVKLNNLEILTLDEADRMLDMGFAPQLREIFRHLPKQRQTLMFSATLPPEIQKLAQTLLRDPVEVKVGQVSQAAPKIDQKTREVKHEEKNGAVLSEINSRDGSILIFARTQKRTDRLAFFLDKNGLQTARIHGGRSQGQRNRAMEDFRSGETRVLVATDIAARGIDIDHVAHVINYDLPQVPEDYVHRIGRTARAGREGQALSLISPEERALWRGIQTLLQGKAKAHSGNPPGAQTAPLVKPAPGNPRPRTKFKPQRAQFRPK